MLGARTGWGRGAAMHARGVSVSDEHVRVQEHPPGFHL